ncbi:UvrD-helicase domain-containing protein [Sulfurovum sp.]|uniref:UvrD-helicase domain-containing protein n=1 Tax=Sulfurovum sp. TaxID=1969726 RepID=UPI002A35C01A|nr:UvrD-helicase domain-containing protein [Sulfurovum sp.]MDD2450314.1 UvrD-helicase domain-containing protein [Sulfurovum sp.]MDY0401887.1 UvrD-helicase domain-containing protein [Sulfurovum sp.]
MRQLAKQIKITIDQKKEYEDAYNKKVKKIITLKADITSIKQQNKTTALEIAKYTQTIDQLPTSFKPTFLQLLILWLSLGIKNYKKEYLSHLETLNNEKNKLKDTLSTREQNIVKIQKEIEYEEIEQKRIIQKIKQLKNEISILENSFDKKLELFKNTLTSFQTKVLKLSKNQYINDYTRNKLKNELNSILKNKDEFLTHSKIKSFLTEIISFYSDDVIWVKNKNSAFIKNEMVREKDFFDTVESQPLTEKQKEAVLVNENNNLILAGAGSGKTSVVVAKVSYLIKKKYFTSK